MSAAPPAMANSEVVELLEAYLDLARAQPKFAHVAIAMTAHPGAAALDFAGEINLQESTLEALTGQDYKGNTLATGDSLSKRLIQDIVSWKLPPRNEYLDESYVVYNLANGPLGFDFAIWLIEAEMRRIRAGAPAPLVVAFFSGRNRETHVDRNSQHRRAWLDSVFRPALRLIGAIEDAAALGGHTKEMFVTRDICKAARAGEAVPRFRALPTEEPLPLPEQFVSITLREANHWPHRNSDLPVWTKFAAYLQHRGENVVFLRDTGKADWPLGGDFQTCPAASVDLVRRMELYSRAKCNLFVANGPVSLCVFSDHPWMQFVTLEPDGSAWIPDTPVFWAKSHGVPVGGQYPWSNERQRMIWQPPTYENLVEAWETHFGECAQAAA